MKNFLATLTTFLIIGIIPTATYAQSNYRNYRNYSDTPNQDQIEFSSRYVFLQVLGRDPDADGLRRYSDAVRNRRLSVIQVRRELVNSAEADRSIRRNYRQAYGRNPNANQFRNAKRSIENGAFINQPRRW